MKVIRTDITEFIHLIANINILAGGAVLTVMLKCNVLISCNTEDFLVRFILIERLLYSVLGTFDKSLGSSSWLGGRSGVTRRSAVSLFIVVLISVSILTVLLPTATRAGVKHADLHISSLVERRVTERTGQTFRTVTFSVILTDLCSNFIFKRHFL